ncbi:hypothetical protein M1V59_28425, partial [Escherichia coli]|nr:hypothetical protein [Escherichia coli]
YIGASSFMAAIKPDIKLQPTVNVKTMEAVQNGMRSYKFHDRDRISDSGARPAMCASGVVRLRGESAGGGKIFPLREYLR